MRTKASSKSNMRFLKGNVLFFALLLLAIMSFVYYSFGEVKADAGDTASCRVSFAADCAPGEYRVLVDDSLLYAGVPLPVDSQLVMKRYATPGSRVSQYTSKSLLRVVVAGDTIARTLDADRVFRIAVCDGAVTVEAVEE
jgi:hypothetical protein